MKSKYNNSNSLHWKKLRDQVLNWDEDYNNSPSEENFCVSTDFVAFRALITKYISVLITRVNGNYEDGGETLPVLHEKSDGEKDLILETRYALRYILTLLCQESRRIYIQEEAVCVYKLHKSVCSLLSTEYCDKKCQLMAAKILCNLGTCNRTTALIILNEVKPYPYDSVGVLNTDTHGETKSDEYNTETGQISNEHTTLFSWGEMIHNTASAGERETLAIIVAAIHNFILAVTTSSDLNAKEENATDSDSCRRIAVDEEDFDIKILTADKLK